MTETTHGGFRLPGMPDCDGHHRDTATAALDSSAAFVTGHPMKKKLNSTDQYPRHRPRNRPIRATANLRHETDPIANTGHMTEYVLRQYQAPSPPTQGNIVSCLNDHRRHRLTQIPIAILASLAKGEHPAVSSPGDCLTPAS
jgi:hypothetical protein